MRLRTFIDIYAGGEGSGNFGHVGRPGEVGGSQPEGEDGQTKYEAKLNKQSEVGIEAVSKLLPEALKSARVTNPKQEWDDLSGYEQSETEDKWKDDALESGDIDVDTSNIEKEYEDNIRNGKDEERTKHVVDATAEDVINALWLHPDFKDYNRPLPGIEPAKKKIDNDTLVYDEDDPSTLVDLDQIKFNGGTPLTEDQQKQAAHQWSTSFDEAIESEMDDVRNSDEYIEQVDELRSEAINEAWNNLSDLSKFTYAQDYDIVEGDGDEVPVGKEPKEWKVTSDDPEDDDEYKATGAIGRELTRLRTYQVLRERGFASDAVDINEIWESWKASSTAETSKAFQLAAAEELGGHHLFSESDVKELREANNIPAMKAYVRAQWEVTQFVMKRAGVEDLQVYRAVMLPSKDLADERKEEISREQCETKYYAAPCMKLPDVKLKRNGLASTTLKRDVANEWSGIGKLPPSPMRVVLRFDVPRTAVLSLPAYGQNMHEEEEVVIFGGKNKWKWDAWLNKAPKFDRVAIAAMKRGRSNGLYTV